MCQMSDIYNRERKKRNKEPAVGDEFAEWLTGVLIEDCASKIADYCKAHKNCETCTFFNGTCRLNLIPCEWDMKKFSK